MSYKIICSSDNVIRNVRRSIYSLPMHIYKHQLYLFEQHSETLTIWSANIGINTEDKSLIMKCSPWCSNEFYATLYLDGDEGGGVRLF